MGRILGDNFKFKQYHFEKIKMGKLANDFWFGDITGGANDHIKSGDSIIGEKNQVAPSLTRNTSDYIAYNDPSARDSCLKFNEKEGLIEGLTEEFTIGLKETREQAKQEEYRNLSKTAGAFIRQYCEEFFQTKYSTKWIKSENDSMTWEERKFQNQLKGQVNRLNQEQHLELVKTVINGTIDECMVGVFKNNMRQVTHDGKMIIDKGILATVPVLISKIYDAVKAIDS